MERHTLAPPTLPTLVFLAGCYQGLPDDPGFGSASGSGNVWTSQGGDTGGDSDGSADTVGPETAGDPTAGDPTAGDPTAGDPTAGDPTAGETDATSGGVDETSSGGVTTGGSITGGDDGSTDGVDDSASGTSDASGSGTTADPTGDPSTTGDPTGGDSTTTGDPTTTGASTSGDGDDEGEFAQGIDLEGLEFNQATSFRVANNGSTLPTGQRYTQIVPYRHALVRAIYSAGNLGTLEGRLTLEHADGRVEVVRTTHNVAGNSSLTALGRTFEWRLDPGQVTPGMRYSVGIYVPGTTGGSTPASPPRIPQSGRDDLGVPGGPMKIEMVLVSAGKSISQANADSVARVLYRLNPASEVNVSVHPRSLGNYSDVSSCLDAVTNLRSSDRPDPWVYYHAVNSGNRGVAWIPGDSMSAGSRRAACSGHWGGSWESVTMGLIAHEHGHNQGTYHAPGCGAANPDSNYPYNPGGSAVLGSFGWNLDTDQTYSASGNYDLMSYCDPTWISDYNYEKWRRRIATLSSWSPRWDPEAREAETVEVLRGIIAEDGTNTWSVSDTTMDGLARLPGSELTATTGDGRILTQFVYEIPIASHGVRAVAVPLPADLDDIAELSISLDEGYTFEVAPVGLRDQFDRMVEDAWAAGRR